MKLLSFHYHLKINIDAPVNDHYFTLRCIPISDAKQRIRQLQYYVFPEDDLSSSEDQWGNALLCGFCHGPHTSFEANICGQAETGLAAGTPARAFEKERIFGFATPLTETNDALKAFSESLCIRSGAPEEAAFVMRSIHDVLSYEPGTTTVRTTAAEAFSMGRGVCQDYAHIMLAVLRDKGIPSRYVVGMLAGEGQSHAWVEVLHRGIWTAFDPTNCLIVSDQHIKLSHGRDAQDCTINRGIFRGQGQQKTDISVIVTESKEDGKRPLW